MGRKFHNNHVIRNEDCIRTRGLSKCPGGILTPDTPNLVTESHFIRGHFLRKNPSTETYVIIYKGYNFEVPLPAPQFKIYYVDIQSMPIEGVLVEEHLEEP